MQFASPREEDVRLRVLRSLHLLDTPAEPAFDRLARLARGVTASEVAMISLIDAERQWLKACVGLEGVKEITRESAFCAHTIMGDEPLWIADTHLDDRFRSNPYVVGPPHVRFYAGAPIEVSGSNIGSLCVLGCEPRPFDAAVQAALQDLAAAAAEQCRLRLANQALAAAESDYRAVFETAADAVCVFDQTGRLLSFNPAAERMFGRSAADVVGGGVEQFMPDEERAGHAAHLARHGVTGLIQWLGASRPGRCRRANGEVFPVEISLTERDRNGRRMFTALIRDVTARKRADEALLESEERYGGLFRRASEGLVIVEVQPDGRFVYSDLNAAMTEMTGLRRLDVVGRSPEDVFGERAVALEAAYRTCVETNTPVQWTEPYDLPTGARAVQVVISPFQDRSGRVCRLLVSGRDVTVRHQAETAARASEARYRRIFEHSLDSLVEISIQDGRAVLESVNPAYERARGVRKEEVVGRSLREVIPAHEADRFEAFCRACLATGRSMDREVVVELPEGPRSWHTVLAPLPHDENGHPRLLGSARDVTDRRAMEERLRVSQKLEAVGELAGGVAHDFNNLLMIIDGYVRGVQEQTPSADLAEALKATERGAALIRQLLMFSRRHVSEVVPIRVSDALRDLEGLLRPLLGDERTLRLDFDPGALGLCAETDVSELGQAILNLASNARDAMPGGGDVLIGLRCVTLDQPQARVLGLEPGDHAEIRVEDSGVGMDADTLSRIFEPYFTTKDQGRGTGLGLAMAYGFAQQSRGVLTAESRPGAGSTFRLLLPVTSRSPIVELLAAEQALRGQGETVLLVEDDEQLLRLARRTLSELGYNVLAARNGLEALELEAEFDGPIPLILTDVVMPLLGGFELAEILRGSRPEAQAVFMSGYPTRGQLKTVAVPDGAVFLQKPFTPAQLARTLRKALARSNAALRISAA